MERVRELSVHLFVPCAPGDMPEGERVAFWQEVLQVIRAPGCCPLLGSGPCLCVASTTPRRQVRAQVPRCLALLRDWHPVLLRALSDLIGWAVSWW